MESKGELEILSEDTVRCFLFPMSAAANLGELCESVNETIHSLSTGYIWHRDEFRVNLPLNADETGLPIHLMSVTCFGDNIDDEWFIVFLLLEISKEYPDLVIQVYDNDGDFLLIEAADFLPSWANPDTTKNRVFIYQNQIHLIPTSIVGIESDIKIQEALKVICDIPDQSKYPEIQQAVLKRIGDPQRFNENIHRAVVTLPVTIAALLTLKPSLISPIVHAYCHHDIIDAKACKNVKFDDVVSIQVKFTKCLYAMLIHSKLLKTVRCQKFFKNDKNTALGLKITCGYEIIMNKLSGNVFASKEFNKFLKSLMQNGYFKGNLEGSRDYKQLLENAKNYFLSIECPMNTQVCNDMIQLMQTDKFAQLKESIEKQSSQETLEEDSDEWLNIHPDQLNDLLKSRYGKQTKFKSGDLINSYNITSELSNFLKQTSDFEGVETYTEDSDSNIEFDSELFVDSLKKMMNFIAPGNDIDSDFDDSMGDSLEEDLDKELKDKLNVNENNRSQNDNDILLNMVKSMKEEGGASGPSSNVLRSIGLNKTDIILDSDDDIE